MRTLWLSACIALTTGAWLAVPAEAQKGKGAGKGGGNGGGKRASTFSPPVRNSAGVPNRQGNGNGGGNRSVASPRDRGFAAPAEPRQTPARSFAPPKSGNDLPQEVRDRLPPGLRDKPADHPGVVNHLRSLGLSDQVADPIPPEVRSQLPPGLRDRPYTHPGVANHLGKMGWRIGEDGSLLPPADPLALDARRQLPAGLRDRPLTDPAVANQLGRMGWTINDDGTLRPPAGYRPEVLPEFRPFGGFFRRW
jgi:hypothetical protein